LAKYEHIDLQQVSVNFDRTGDCDVLELNVFLPVTPDVPVIGSKPQAKSLRL